MRVPVLGMKAGAAVLAVMASLAGLVPSAQGQTAPVESPYFAEFLRRIVDPVQQGLAPDLSGLEKGDTVRDATTHFARDGSFVATLAPKGDGVQILSTASADENPKPPARNVKKVFVVMTKAEIGALIAAFVDWQSTTEGVTEAARCDEWEEPGAKQTHLLQAAATLVDAAGRPMILEVHVGNIVSPALADRMKPIWLASLVLTVGDEWRC